MFASFRVHNGHVTEKNVPTLYDWAGGIDRIRALFEAFYTRVPADPLLGPERRQKSQSL